LSAGGRCGARRQRFPRIGVDELIVAKIKNVKEMRDRLTFTDSVSSALTRNQRWRSLNNEPRFYGSMSRLVPSRFIRPDGTSLDRVGSPRSEPVKRPTPFCYVVRVAESLKHSQTGFRKAVQSAIDSGSACCTRWAPSGHGSRKAGVARRERTHVDGCIAARSSGSLRSECGCPPAAKARRV
jgi:hypothetical protein